jgi:enoyl-CoA hydratase/carnithine racemase
MGDRIIARVSGPLLEIVLNRPDKRNAITWEMLQEIDGVIRRAQHQPDLRAVVLRGEGTCFSAGIDLTSLMQVANDFGEGWKQRMRDITTEFQAVPNRLERLELPTIAVLHGHCLGLGLELALACDIRLAAEGTRLGLPETLRGLIPDVGGTTRLARLVGPAWAKELIFTSRAIDAEMASRIGLVNHVVPIAELPARVEALVKEISAAAPLAVGMSKRVVDGLFDSDRGLQLEGWAQSQLIGTEDVMEGIQAFMEKRPPQFKGR